MESKKFDVEQSKKQIHKLFEESFLPGLKDFIRIPNISQYYDTTFFSNGFIQKAGHFLVDWCRNCGVKGLEVRLLEPEKRTPLLFVEVVATEKECAATQLFYGHFDKQPHMTGWDEGLSATDPVVRNGKLFGRGGADDGYCIFAFCTALKILQDQGLPHPRCIFLMESDEESGSEDMDYYLKLLSTSIGNHVKNIWIVDSGCLDYSTLWLTTSLRGGTTCKLSVEVSEQSVHSGLSGGVIPHPFRIANILLQRIQNQKTGQLDERLTVVIPPEKYKQCIETAELIRIKNALPFESGVETVCHDNQVRDYLAQTWMPSLTITGIDGFPSCIEGGCVLHNKCTMKVSIRLPPTKDMDEALEFIKK